jgi:hypothetical protein
MQRLQSLVRRIFPQSPVGVPAAGAVPTPLTAENIKSVSGGLPNGTWATKAIATGSQKPSV